MHNTITSTLKKHNTNKTIIDIITNGMESFWDKRVRFVWNKYPVNWWSFINQQNNIGYNNCYGKMISKFCEKHQTQLITQSNSNKIHKKEDYIEIVLNIIWEAW